MEDFVVSARKYRPQTFDTVVGQEKITETLLKSIENHHLAHAFLFCGPRGVGKTTCARILARMVNQYGQPDADPDADFSFNIFELDAASNNGVDDIRSINDQVRIPPQTGKYKIYIIDEVHMLSPAAFNAFLKTLEEPPPYAIFILATTEKHKILPTILSRCQVFDFHRIQIPEIVEHLRGIASSENIEIGSDALHIIAEKADGALRDALSIFDQMVSFSGNKVTYEHVIEHLNILDYDHYFSITDACLEQNRTVVLKTFNTILNNGFDGHNFLNGLAVHFRNLLFCSSTETATLLDVGDNIRQRYTQQSQKCTTDFLIDSLNVLSDADVNYKASRNARLLVEISMMKLCALPDAGLKKKASSQPLAKATDGNSSSTLSKPFQREPEAKGPGTNMVAEPASSLAQSTASASAEEPDQNTLATPIEEEEVPEIVVKTQSTEEPSPADEVLPSGEVQEIQEKDNQTNPANESSSAGIQENGGSENVLKNRAPAKGLSSRLAAGKVKGMASIHSLSEDIEADIKQVNTENKGEDEEESLDGRPSTDFNQQQLWTAWDDYADKIKLADRRSYHATLTRHKPIMRSPYLVELLLDNEIQLADLDLDKANLLMHLRESLNNWQIQLQGVMDEQEATDAMPYTADAKYREMLKINPNLGRMKEMFDLEVDFDD